MTQYQTKSSKTFNYALQRVIVILLVKFRSKIFQYNIIHNQSECFHDWSLFYPQHLLISRQVQKINLIIKIPFNYKLVRITKTEPQFSQVKLSFLVFMAILLLSQG